MKPLTIFDVQILNSAEEPDFNGKLTKKVQFVVVKPNDSGRKEKKFELSRIHVGKLRATKERGLQLSR